MIPVNKDDKTVSAESREFILANKDHPTTAEYLVGVADGHQPSIFWTPDSPYAEFCNTHNFVWLIARDL